MTRKSDTEYMLSIFLILNRLLRDIFCTLITVLCNFYLFKDYYTFKNNFIRWNYNFFYCNILVDIEGIKNYWGQMLK